MLRGDALEGRFEKRARSRPIAYAAEIGDDGLVLGAGTILARMTRDSLGEPALDLEEGADRLYALLAAAHGRPMSTDLPRHLGEAFAHWRRGEKALANIRLAFAQIPRLDDRADAYRLFLAEELLDAGMSPAALMKGLGFDAPARGLAKYDPNQPRVPAGSGRNSGRWGSGGGAAQAPAPATSAPAPAAAMRAVNAPGTLAEGLFASAADSAFLSGLETLASAAVGPAAMLGAIFIPTPAGVVSHGAMPGEPGLSYLFDGPAGLLRLYRDDETGRQAVAEARLRPDGILAETETGLPIARMVGGSLVFDADSLPDAKAGAGARSERDEPKLCPDPGRDVPHGASERAMLYQEQISRLNNPQRPLSRGDAVSLMNPLTGKNVAFDDCRESDGTMIEAKGPGFAEMLNIPIWTRASSRAMGSNKRERKSPPPERATSNGFSPNPRPPKKRESGLRTTRNFKKSKYSMCPRRLHDERSRLTEIKTTDSKGYYIRASWEGRAETPGRTRRAFPAHDRRLQRNRSRFQPLDLRQKAHPRNSKWSATVTPRKSRRECRGRLGGTHACRGYWFGAVTRDTPRDRSFAVRCNAGATVNSPFPNDVTLTTSANNAIRGCERGQLSGLSPRAAGDRGRLGACPSGRPFPATHSAKRERSLSRGLDSISLSLARRENHAAFDGSGPSICRTAGC